MDKDAVILDILVTLVFSPASEGRCAFYDVYIIYLFKLV